MSPDSKGQDLAAANSLWYKDAVIYQLQVKSFYDSNDDGRGDFRGLIQKLDYLESLGLTALWLLPFYPSPLRDDGYDIQDYRRIRPEYGNMADFRRFLRQAHARGIRVITELVLNHTSDQHRWFQRARKAPAGSVERDFYVWSDTPDKYTDARIIFQDSETSNWTWDSVAKAYYWHRFYAHQPDLNYHNPEVKRAMFDIVDHWFNMGVDGIRLDAVPYLFEREGTDCENLPETYALLRELRAHVDAKFTHRMLLAEANQWPENAVAYFGTGDMCHMAYHFPLMPRMFMALQMEDNFPIIDILDQTPPIPATCQWAMFLRNHDELTLEMVTDEERDYMYAVYARDPSARLNLGIRRRLAPLLANDRRKIEALNVLLFSLPGSPIIYYGDEIGMGDNYYLGDRDGVRTPMQWSPDRNAGFSRVNSQRLYLPVIIDPEYHYAAVNVENQEQNGSSLLWWMRRLVTMRRQLHVLATGEIEFLHPENAKVLAFIRRDEESIILVVVNLSRYAQVVELDLAELAGQTPIELFSTNPFPPIRESPYTLTLGSYDYYWLQLQRLEDIVPARERTHIPEMQIHHNWGEILQGKARERLEEKILPAYLKAQRWFGGKGRSMRRVRIKESLALKGQALPGRFVLVEVEYTEGLPQTYLLCLAFLAREDAAHVVSEHPEEVVTLIRDEAVGGIVCDGVHSEEFRQALLLMMARGDSAAGEKVSVHGHAVKSFTPRLARRCFREERSGAFRAEQSNTSILYGDKYFLKLFRRMEEGVNPDLEIGRFLTEKTNFTQLPSFVGALQARGAGLDQATIAMAQQFVPSQADGWTYALDAAGRYFEKVLSQQGESASPPKQIPYPSAVAARRVPDLLQGLMDVMFLEMIAQLGRRTAQFHLALSRETEEQLFQPVPFSLFYQRSLYQSLHTLTKRNLRLLRRSIRNLEGETREDARQVHAQEKQIIDTFRSLLGRKLTGMRIRIHNDYHLGQVLYTGNDFVIIDFEGEPAQTMAERKRKRSPLKDVAGMLRSFHYAAHSSVLTGPFSERFAVLEPWARLWSSYAGGVFLHAYEEATGDAPFLPQDAADKDMLLQVLLLGKAVYELGYELNNRPLWVGTALKGIKNLMEGQ